MIENNNLNIGKIEVLDCTLRDGGLGIEDDSKFDSKVKQFSKSETEKLIDLLSNSKLDYIELGSIQETGKDLRGFAIYESLEDVSKIVPEAANASYAALFRGPDIDLDKIPLRKDVNIDCLRLIVRYSEIEKSLDFCFELSKKGYKVFIQPMVTKRYSEDELKMLIDYANSMNAYALYFVDSYGYMEESDIEYYFTKFDSLLNQGIRIGFHGHNNMNLAFSNAIKMLKFKTNRSIILDSTLLGMGQGAGNLQTELILGYLNNNYNKNYNLEAILDACEIIETFKPNCPWGYSVVYLIAAINKTAYKFSKNLRNRGLKYKEIYRLLKNIPDDMRHRYTVENEKMLYESL